MYSRALSALHRDMKKAAVAQGRPGPWRLRTFSDGTVREIGQDPTGATVFLQTCNWERGKGYGPPPSAVGAAQQSAAHGERLGRVSQPNQQHQPGDPKHGGAAKAAAVKEAARLQAKADVALKAGATLAKFAAKKAAEAAAMVYELT